MTSPLTVDPTLLADAANDLQVYSAALADAALSAATPTTGIAPATGPGEPVGVAVATAFSAFGTQLQAALAQGLTYQTAFVTNLDQASDTYSLSESSNAADAALGASGPGSIIDFISGLLGGPLGSTNGEPFSLSSNTANLFNIGGGNWASAASALLGMAGGGLLPAASDTIGDAAASAALASSTTPVGGMGVGGMGFGGMPMAGMGQGTLVGNLSVPPTWAGGQVTPVAGTSTAPLRTVGWTAAAPEAGAGTFIPGMPGMGAGTRSSTGFGAPRYGVKPIVMPKPAAV